VELGFWPEITKNFQLSFDFIDFYLGVASMVLCFLHSLFFYGALPWEGLTMNAPVSSLDIAPEMKKAAENRL